MVRDHEAVNEKALALVKALRVTPEDNATSRGLARQAEETRRSLSDLSGATFDKAYVDNEIAYHRTVNGALESVLIPNASDGELKAMLETGLKIFRGHEQHEEALASSLK
jgi:putative membrane protein